LLLNVCRDTVPGNSTGQTLAKVNNGIILIPLVNSVLSHIIGINQ
jgi:hypothetical protein